MRLIDADLLKGIPIKDKLERKFQTFNLDDAYEEGWFDAIETIEKQPTVEAEPMVRCKDCKYWNKHHFVDIYVCSIHNKEGQYPHLLFEMTADDFCSRGERRGEEDG